MNHSVFICKIVFPVTRVLGTESTKTLVFKLSGAPEPLGGLVKTVMLDPIWRVSDSFGLGWELKLCISNRVPRRGWLALLIWGPYTVLRPRC